MWLYVPYAYISKCVALQTSTTNYVCAKQQQLNAKKKISYFGKHFKHGFLHVKLKKNNKALMIYVTFLCWNKTVVQYLLRLTEFWNVLWNYCNSMHFLRKCYIWMYWIHDIILCALLRDADLWLAKNPALQNFFQTDISACPIVHVANKYFSVLPYQNLLKWNDLFMKILIPSKRSILYQPFTTYFELWVQRNCILV